MTTRSVPLPPALRAALLELFGPGVDNVRVIEHSWYARLHGRIVATTRRRRICLRGSAEDFFDDPEIVLHEYFHVLHQWEPRRLSVWRYLLEWMRRGYWDNRFEVEAREFAADHLYRFRALLSRHGAGPAGGAVALASVVAAASAENAFARVEPRRDPGEHDA